MNDYEYVLSQIRAGVSSFIVAMLSIFFYFISTGTLSQNNMSASNLAAIMTSLGYTYDTATDTFNDGSVNYSTYLLIDKVITDYYAKSEPLNVGVMRLMIVVCNKKLKITDEQKSALLARL